MYFVVYLSYTHTGSDKGEGIRVASLPPNSANPFFDTSKPEKDEENISTSHASSASLNVSIDIQYVGDRRRAKP